MKSNTLTCGTFLYTCLCCSAVSVVFCQAKDARGADLESFEFNDAPGNVLMNAVNTANPGNGWLEDSGTIPSGMAPSDIRGGVYNIVKSTSVLESNYFQVANITSGTRYLVARMSGWNFQNFDPANLEEFRVAFIHDDDANFGSTISAQMTIRRDTGGGIEIAADAIGTGSSDIPSAAPLAVTQTQPFTAVLELNKTSNSYKVFYKDGTNPTQVLGIGAISPTRDGNAVRMAVNNSFGDFSIDYPVEFLEVLSVDRMAVADTNPFTDLITLEIDRTSGAMTLRNTSGAAISNIESYSITSAAGAMNPPGWDPISTNITTTTNEELAESFAPSIGLTNGQDTPLSTGTGAWLKSPFEDVHMVVNLAGGAARTVNVNFVGNGGLRWMPGDLNFDNALNASDWTTFITNSESNLGGLSIVEAYQRGDLNSDGFNNIADFAQFKTLYDAANGAGSFELMLASVPEPGSIVLVGSAAALVLTIGRRRRKRAKVRRHREASSDSSTNRVFGDSVMPRAFTLLRIFVIAASLHAATPAGYAAILEDFSFGDPNDTPLESAENSVNVANTWILGGNSFDPSAVLNGNYRITKTSGALATAHIDIANVTSGKVWLVAELAGWNFTATPSATSEQVRFAFLDNDNDPPGGSTITAQMDIRRMNSALALVGIGALGTGATDVAGSFALPLVRSTPFTMVLELDKGLDQYTVYYKDNTDPFQALGTGNLGESTLNDGDRDGNSIRFAPTGAFNDTGEFFDISRIYLTDTSPIGGPVDPVALTLRVLSSGQVSIINDTDSAITFDSYRITSPSPANALNFAGWNSLSDKLPLLSAVDGPDPGTTAGDGIGETWDEAGGSNDNVLAESFLLGSTTMAPNDTLSLGNAFKPGGAQTLAFEYRDAVTGAIAVGSIEYLTAAGIAGDYNNNNVVDAADYVVWRNNQGTSNTLPNDPIGGTIGGAHYNQWRANFGKSPGSGSLLAAIPEPTALCLVLIAVGARLGAPRRKRRFAG